MRVIIVIHIRRVCVFRSNGIMHNNIKYYKYRPFLSSLNILHTRDRSWARAAFARRYFLSDTSRCSSRRNGVKICVFLQVTIGTQCVCQVVGTVSVRLGWVAVGITMIIIIIFIIAPPMTQYGPQTTSVVVIIIIISLYNYMYRMIH